MNAVPGHTGRVVPIAVGLSAVAADQFTKWLALTRLDDGPIDVVWTLRFRLAFNSGMAFGTGQGWGPVIAVASFVVVVILARSMWRQRSGITAVALGLLVGGATGNLIDRILRSPGPFRGSVVDFIDFGWFPVFNIADIAINVGAGLLVLSILVESRHKVEDQS
jgi:signal peptidase II